MSTVKIKTEPTAATAAITAATAAITAATVDVQVKLEPSLSTADIKLEQHTSDIDSKFESDSEVDSDIKSESDDNSDGTDQSHSTESSKNQRQLICEYLECNRRFNSVGYLKRHQHDHKLQTELNIFGKSYTLARLSLDDRWPCPMPNCTSTVKTVFGLSCHIHRYHRITMTQQHQQQQPPSQNSQRTLYFHDVDDFYVNSIRCGYYNTIGVFICYECRLVPECLLTHLQQKHGFDEKSIDNSTLPESKVNANADLNGNQHTSNSFLASAIGRPYQQQHRDIIQGWLCVTSECGYCGYTAGNKFNHKSRIHQGEQISTIPALVLCLSSSKAHASYFLITRIDQASGAVATNSGRVNRHRLDYNHSGLNAQDENDDDTDQNETTEESNRKKQWKCEHPNCERLFNSSDQSKRHRREHLHEVAISVYGTTFTLTRQPSDDRWLCPIPDCNTLCKTINCTREHILSTHNTLLKYKRANDEDDVNQQQQRVIKKRQRTRLYLKVDDFYVNGVRYGYHSTIGVFICYECRLVPECVLTHLQQKHGYDTKSIDNGILPDSAVSVNADPNINQHTSNQHLVAAISEPNQLHHPDIVQGWLCPISDCGHCCFAKKSINQHQYKEHMGEQQSAVPALALRLLFGKTRTSSFLITRLDTNTNSSVKSDSSTSQHNNECDNVEDGDELVLSDYSDEDDIH